MLNSNEFQEKTIQWGSKSHRVDYKIDKISDDSISIFGNVHGEEDTLQFTIAVVKDEIIGYTPMNAKKESMIELYNALIS